MDIINHCLSLVPVPGLSAVFSILRIMVSTVQEAQVSRQQLIALAASTAQLMKTLNAEYTSGRLSTNGSVEALKNLERWVLLQLLTRLKATPVFHLWHIRLLNQISEFVQHQTACSFLKSMYNKYERVAQIDAYHHQLETLVISFQVSCLHFIHIDRKNHLLPHKDFGIA